ncbi:RagB/SusD family nutrient uptake outer membrane protein [Spirosoma sp. BT702]|uniref:RagB/SusD family nutrient uptake outer membrane protein n=1 Tax=Spirosoma profusum TaxID=2771354 RepID=A0A926XWH2_9BACT|nr:RagB/SusD family nutrient uptake outer membrane protein [Spirosoma profusum]MBD2701206.1 RagB/SusD family nutrient uptake outer membrane protein [Spirosoma profusum]
MTQFIRYSLAILLISLASCQQVLEPQPTTLLVDNLVLNEPNDVQPVRIGLYSALRGMSAPNIMAGDFTADYVQANGTFTDNIEFGTKRITATNGIVNALWGSIYNTVYVANFILEKLPAITNISDATRKTVTAEARFLRGWANFIGAYTYGDIPRVTTTDPVTNRTVPRVAKATILASVLEDYQAALADLPNVTSASTNATNNATYLNKVNCRAAMARYYLYLKNWVQAEDLSTQVINSNVYKIEPEYANVITKDFISESILEVGYNLSDDPGTSATSLNNILVGRREIIPSNQYVSLMISAESGTRRETITFDAQQQRGNDNGWTVRKYGTASEDNNNIVLMRLAEMYLIRAEARAQQNKITGANGAVADLNALRARAKAPVVALTAQGDVLLAVERERIYELSFEGHRWYDLVRTGRAQAVLSAFSPNWNNRFELWPIPQPEIQQNSALTQNPGY